MPTLPARFKSVSEMKERDSLQSHYANMEPLGLIDNDTDAERILHLREADTVLPTQAACTLIDEHLLGNVDI